MRICHAKNTLDYPSLMAERGDRTVQDIARGMNGYKDSKEPAHRYWYRLALMEARNRGLVV